MNRDNVEKLLGAELAQDDPNFLKFAIKRDDVLRRVANQNKNFLIINATRGSGKSGLLIILEDEIRKTLPSNHVVIRKFYTDVQYPNTSMDFSNSLNFWKNTILSWIVSEIGARINTPLDNDTAMATDFAEAVGAKEIDKTLELLRVDQPLVDRTNFDERLTDNYLKRLVDKSKFFFWLLLDEFDDDYKNTPRINHKLLALLKAANHITQITNSINIRVTIRPHVLTTIIKESDVGQTFRQKIVDLKWDHQRLLELLSRRIDYFDGNLLSDQYDFFEQQTSEPTKDWKSLHQTIGKYFEPADVSLNRKQNITYKAITTLSLYRPRWMIELCGLALEAAEGNYATTKDLKRALHTYGENRVMFLSGEHRHHFPDLEAIVNKLAGLKKHRLGNSSSLKKILIDNIISTGIRSVNKSAPNYLDLADTEALRIAQSLYMVEFIRARQKLGGKDDHRFYEYVNNPSLLSSWTDRPNTVWEIHPTFARGLQIIDSDAFYTQGEVRLLGDRKSRKRR